MSISKVSLDANCYKVQNSLGSKVCISHNKATIIVFCLANNIFMVARLLSASHKTDYDCWLEFFVAHSQKR